MELRSVQSASQISILQTADIRLDLDAEKLDSIKYYFLISDF